jgi:hypothetical protein
MDSGMMRTTLLLLMTSFLFLGCSSEPVTAVRRQFPIGFSQAEPKLRELYPPTLSWQKVETETAKKLQLTGPMYTIRRDEVSYDDAITIVIDEGEKMRARRTEIIVTDLGNGQTSVSVQASISKKTVLLPDRDTAKEQMHLSLIESALK